MFAYIAEYLGNPGGVVAINETGFPKKGNHSAEVARRYSGILGRIANCQAGVFTTYAVPRGHTLLNQGLCLSRTGQRGAAAGSGPGSRHVLRDQAATVIWCMLERVRDTGSKKERWYARQCRILAEPENADRGQYLLFRHSCTDADDWQPHGAAT